MAKIIEGQNGFSAKVFRQMDGLAAYVLMLDGEVIDANNDYPTLLRAEIAARGRLARKAA